MNQNKPVTLGIVGCGRITETRHLPALALLPQGKVLGMTDIDPERLGKVADRFQVPRRYSTLEQLLQDQEIEAVAICVPANLHVPFSLAVLEAGKHLFVEKPIALDPTESEKLVKKSKESSRVTMVGFNLRWHRLVRQARPLIQSGILGKLKTMHSTFTSATRNSAAAPSWRHKRELGGGVLIDQAVHHFDLWRFLLQDEVEEVFATAVDDDESAVVVAKMAKGLLVSSSFSEGTANENEFVFCGNDARLRLSCYHFDGLEVLSARHHPGDLNVRINKMISLVKQSPLAVSQFFRGSDFVASYKNEWLHFFDCVRGNQLPDASLDDGHRSVQILTAILDSTVRKMPVKVTYDLENVEIAGDA
jgi:myo-inositol 2-dehydrogenase / D-chiro-inositol 1-dehydrogenase